MGNTRFTVDKNSKKNNFIFIHFSLCQYENQTEHQHLDGLQEGQSCWQSKANATQTAAKAATNSLLRSM